MRGEISKTSKNEIRRAYSIPISFRAGDGKLLDFVDARIDREYKESGKMPTFSAVVRDCIVECMEREKGE
jgi:hypothetical protein